MAAVTAMRAHRAQLAVVTDNGITVGFVALEDLLEQVIGELDDEPDVDDKADPASTDTHPTQVSGPHNP
jgi:CBS domain containing-hemolysin-like protein